jgi:beta-lactamase class A
MPGGGADDDPELDAVFAAAGATGRLHAVDIDGGGEAGTGADEPVVLASVFKVLLALEFARQSVAGQLDPRERAVVTAADRLGGWGTAGCRDDVEMSLRDLALYMMAMSDNSAADVLMRRVGPDTVRLLARELGLTRTRITGGPREMLATMIADVGARDEAEFAAVYPALPPERIRRLRILDPAHGNASTPREMTTLLRLIWTDLAGPPEACALVRSLMAQQVFRHRLPTGFADEVRVAAKTGTLPGLHNEAGVVEYPDGGRYAVAVFARTAEPTAVRAGVDAAIGRAARLAVERIRAGSPGPGAARHPVDLRS